MSSILEEPNQCEFNHSDGDDGDSIDNGDN